MQSNIRSIGGAAAVGAVSDAGPEALVALLRAGTERLGREDVEAIGEAGVDGALVDLGEAVLRALGRRVLGGDVGDEALQASVKALQRLETAVHGEKLRRVAELDARNAHVGRARSTAELLAQDLRVTRGEARQTADTARALARLPKTAARLRAGELGVAQAREAAGQLAELDRLAVGGAALPADAAARLDALVADEGVQGDRVRLRRAVQDWVAEAAPEVLANRERRAWRNRRAWLGRTPEGGWRLEAELCALGGAHVAAALAPLTRPDGVADERSQPQRTADALVELARRALDAGDLPEVAAQRPHVLLIAAPEGLHGVAGAPPAQLDGVGAVSGDTARQICCDADLTPLVLSGDRRVLAVGRANGDPTRAQRLAVIARDRRCIGCGAPALRCQIHHIAYRARGGKTAIGNLVLVCWSCHTNIHHCGWTVQRTPDGRYSARPPGHPASPSQRHTT